MELLIPPWPLSAEMRRSTAVGRGGGYNHRYLMSVSQGGDEKATLKYNLKKITKQTYIWNNTHGGGGWGVCMCVCTCVCVCVCGGYLVAKKGNMMCLMYDQGGLLFSICSSFGPLTIRTQAQMHMNTQHTHTHTNTHTHTHTTIFFFPRLPSRGVHLRKAFILANLT